MQDFEKLISSLSDEMKNRARRAKLSIELRNCGRYRAKHGRFYLDRRKGNNIYLVFKANNKPYIQVHQKI